MSRLSRGKKIHFRSGLVFAAWTTSPAVSFFFFHFCVYLLSFFLPCPFFVLFCFVNGGRFPALPFSAGVCCRGSAGSFTDWSQWLIRPVLPVGHRDAATHVFGLLFFGFFFKFPTPFLSSLCLTSFTIYLINMTPTGSFWYFWSYSLKKRTSDKFRGIINNCPIFTLILYEKFEQNSKLRRSTWIKPG